MKISENAVDIFKALVNVQGEMTAASKNANNPFFKNKYADLNAIRDAIKEPLKKNNMFYTQNVTTTESSVAVTTLIGHGSGQWMEYGPLEIFLAKKDAQSVGSAISYAKRYQLCAALGVVTEDDDGEAAMQGTTKRQEDAVKKAPPEPKVTQEQVDMYLNQYGDDRVMFEKFMKEKMVSNNWSSMEHAVKIFIKQNEYTKKAFSEWRQQNAA